jgi:antitoxin HigA-1
LTHHPNSGLPLIYSGEFLAGTLDEPGISQAQFVRAIGDTPMRVSHVVNRTCLVTAELALLFGRALGQSPQDWLNLQAAYDLKIAEAVIELPLASIFLDFHRLDDARLRVCHNRALDPAPHHAHCGE